MTMAIPAAAQLKDAPGCKDPALFPNRMPNYRIERCETKPYDFFEFNTAKPPKQRVEGELTFVQYGVERAEDSRSGIEVVRNYENAIKKIGGTIQASSNWWVVVAFSATLTFEAVKAYHADPRPSRHRLFGE